MSKKVLLNCMPPSIVGIPSPGLTVIKTFLENNGYVVDIIYWNLIFNSIQKDFFNFNEKIDEDESINILPFNSYIAAKSNDNALIEKILSRILYEKPQFHIKGKVFLRDRLFEFVSKIEKIFDEQINLLNIQEYEYIGITFQFYQWISGNILVEKLKIKNKKLKVIIGGFGTKQSAYAFLKNFEIFDFAIWGEGEYPILELLHELDSLVPNFKKVPNLVYRENERLEISEERNKYVNLNSSFINDFSDYFNQIHKYTLDEIVRIPVETGRGCHWNKCHFCFLNTGYKFRNKSSQTIIKEIETYILSYKINKFIFLDNDTIGNDYSSFNIFLDDLILLRSKYPRFEIYMAEIVTKDI
ncbi:MAG: hypothetical protein Q4G63_12780, partial [Bacteroidia bacterium]|nr:hypothetical protein [Bacteroidia bacterium]